MSTPDFILNPDHIEAAVAQLPSLPTVALELMRSLDDDAADAEHLAGLIASDQALVASLLRIANSSFYGMSGKIHTIRDAMVLIGLRGVRSLAIAASVSAAFSRQGRGFNLHRFWRHSIAVAVSAQELARARHMNPDMAFAAGLLHDIGRLVLANGFPEHYAEVERWRSEHDALSQDAERAVLGTDHADVGRQVTRNWRFPAALCDAIGGHHHPDALAAPLTALIHVADSVAIGLSLYDDPAAAVPPLHPGAWTSVAPEGMALVKTLGRIEMQYEAATGLLPT